MDILSVSLIFQTLVRFIIHITPEKHLSRCQLLLDSGVSMQLAFLMIFHISAKGHERQSRLILFTQFVHYEWTTLMFFSFTNQNPFLSIILNHLRQPQYSQLLIHLHLLSIDDDRLPFPSNISLIPLNDSLCCFCYRNLIS